MTGHGTQAGRFMANVPSRTRVVWSPLEWHPVDAGLFNVGSRAMGQVAPVGDFTTDEKGQAAYAEIQIGVSSDYRDIGLRVDLSGPQAMLIPASLAPTMTMRCMNAPLGLAQK